jgi:hypothetical protein
MFFFSNKNEFDEEPELPSPDSLLTQFQRRQIFIESVTVVDDRMLTDSWTATPGRQLVEEIADQQVVALDLVELTENYLPQDFNLISEVQKVSCFLINKKLNKGSLYFLRNYSLSNIDSDKLN